MKTIKFRIWNKRTNAWVEGHGRHKEPSLDGVNLFGETILCGAFMNGVSLEELNDCEALQYTGVNDVNGVEIFEGDIVKFKFKAYGQGSVVHYRGTGQVVYKETEARFVVQTKKIDEDLKQSDYSIKFEVVGNIYENPKLIK